MFAVCGALLVAAQPTDAFARPAALVLEPDRKVCILERFVQTSFPVRVRPIGEWLGGQLADRLEAGGFGEVAIETVTSRHPIAVNEPDDCSASQGDVVVRLLVEVDRIGDRYTISLSARSATSHYSDVVRRKDARTGPRTRFVGPDNIDGPFDAWAYAVDRALIEDAIALANRLASQIVVRREE